MVTLFSPGIAGRLQRAFFTDWATTPESFSLDRLSNQIPLHAVQSIEVIARQWYVGELRSRLLAKGRS